ncbi:magnesium/cobalt transporter CorA [Bacteroidota bacterium]
MNEWLTKKLNLKAGLPPGTISPHLAEDQTDTVLTYLSFNKEDFHEKQIEVKDIPEIFNTDNVDWLTITGFKDIDKILQIGQRASIHRMLLEDSLNTEHIPKFEVDDNYLVFMIKSFYPEDQGVLNQCHNCIFLGDQLVIHLQERDNNILKERIERIKQSKGKTRTKKADYLFYLLIDAFIDTYYNYLENLRESLLDLEDNLLSEKNMDYTEEIHSTGKKLTHIQKNLFPLKDAVNQILKDELDIISKDNLIYFNDLKDHVNELIVYYNSFRDMIISLHSLNESNLNQAMNSTMKLLTIIATIFIPLTFIAGIYGMNFKFMPELEWPYSYPILLSVMTLIGVIMIFYMKRKKWF